MDAIAGEGPGRREWGREKANGERMTIPKRTYRLQIMLNADELAVLDAWLFERRMPSRSDAVRELMRLGQDAPGDSAEWPAKSADFGIIDPPID
jgi:hypothetical protein